MAADREHMRRALDLARSVEGYVSPRPPVGCVIVTPDGRVAGEGTDEPAPGPHAEVVALKRAAGAARGATAYVSLEPCSHSGDTPPCADALAGAGVSRVVAGCRDPNPAVSGNGIRALRRAGIDTRLGPLRREAEAMIEPFAMWVTQGRPLVTLKIAASLDGKIAAPDGTSRWITGPDARREVHELRSRVDAVLTGAGTVITDDPLLTCRLDGYEGRQPSRVVLDSGGRIPATARVFDGGARTVVLTTVAHERPGAEVVVVPRGEGGVNLPAALRALGGGGMCHVMAECGPALAGSLLAEGLVDRLVLYLAPTVIGGEAPGLFGAGAKTLEEAWRLRIDGVSRVGEDIRIDARRAGGFGGSAQRAKRAADPPTRTRPLRQRRTPRADGGFGGVTADPPTRTRPLRQRRTPRADGGFGGVAADPPTRTRPLRQRRTPRAD